MKIVMLMGGGLFFVVSSIVGLRLLALGIRNRTLPELSLAAAFLLGGTIGGLLGQLVYTRSIDLEPAQMGALVLTYTVFSMLGMTLYNVFTWRVFRPDAAGAAVVGFVLLTGLGMMAWYASIGSFGHGRVSTEQRAVETLINAVGPVWAMIEALRYYRRMRRRLALGLADPVVANRILLWGIGSALASTIVLASLIQTVVPPTHILVELATLNIGVCGSVASLIYALAFFPPARYRAWLRAGAPAAPVPGD